MEFTKKEQTASEALYRAPMSTRTADTRSFMVLKSVSEAWEEKGFTYE